MKEPCSKFPKPSQKYTSRVTEKSQLVAVNGAAQAESQPWSTPSRMIAHGKSLAVDGRACDAELPLIDYATPVSDVSAFCRAVMSRIIPDGFWGRDDDGLHNKAVVLRNVDQFIRLRRFESLTLHTVSQDLKVALTLRQA